MEVGPAFALLAKGGIPDCWLHQHPTLSQKTRERMGHSRHFTRQESLHYYLYKYRKTPPYRGFQFSAYSERNACMISTRAARAAGIIDAITATAISTIADSATGSAPGIFMSTKYLPPSRAARNPNPAPATTPAAAIRAPSTITPRSRSFGCDPSARRIPNSRIRAVTEKVST